MPPVMMAGGGSTSQDPQSQGRYGDSMLVHMNPQEVAGLQALARNQGTSLTINPQTGYPEAFNLKRLLPLIAGVALGPAGYGLTATQAGLATAALGTAATGSLKEGIKAGLGAYGGAGIGEGLVGATPPPPGMEGSIAGTTGITPPPTPTDPSLVGNQYSLAGPSSAGTPMASVNQANVPPVPEFNLTSNTPTSSPNFLPTESSGLTVPSTQATTAKTVGLSTTTSPDKFLGNLSGKDTLKVGSALASSMYEPPEYKDTTSKAMIRPYTYDYENLSGAPVSASGIESPRFRGTFIEEEPYAAAQGGLMSYAKGGRTVRKPISRDDPFYIFGEDMSKIAEEQFAKGGISSLGPRFLSGGGDGMSDDIPAVIGDRQPARLADGEFVIPADVVSHIGNGSSKAGAKKLYKMMADVRKDRTGKTKQAPAIKPERHMPV